MTPALDGILADIQAEAERAVTKHGDQSHLPNGTQRAWTALADHARRECDEAAARGEVTWLHVLNEEVCESFAETDDASLRAELVQVAAVAALWIATIDGRVTTR
jgi:hypothetical protein